MPRPRSRPTFARLAHAAWIAGLPALASPLRAQQFVDVTVPSGLGSPVDVQGVAFADADGDGDLDVYLTLVLSSLLGVGNQLYRNDGVDPGTGEVALADVAVPSGAADDQTSYGACFADLDNDGDADLLVANGAADFAFLANALHLYRNNGTGLYSEEGSTSGLDGPGSGRSVVVADYDNDGRLDFFLCTPDAVIFGERYHLYHNDGVDPGTGYLRFSDVTGAAGLATSAKNTDAAAWGDYDGDGDTDLFVSNHGVSPFRSEANELYRNMLKETGTATFIDVAGDPGVGMDDSQSSEGAAWGDCDNDGDLDLYVATGFDIIQIFGINAPNRLHVNQGGGQFVEDASGRGVDDRQQLSFSAAWGDFDNDGWLDLYVTNSQLSTSNPADKLYRNLGNCTFAEWTGAGVSDPGSGQGTALGDMDADGDLDIFVANLNFGGQTAHLYRNRNEALNPGHHWLVIDTVGTVSNRDGIGARVTAFAGGRTFHREVHAGSGYLSEDSLDVEFGFGTIGAVDRLEIRWPSGCVQIIPSPAIDRRLVVFEDCMAGFDSVSATDDPCTLGISLAWEPASFASGTGHYEIRRGTTCADAQLQPEQLPRPVSASHFDATTIGGVAYAYAVRAVDDVDGMSAWLCVPPVVDVFTAPPVVDPDSLRVARQGATDPRLTWTFTGTGAFDVRRNVDRFAWAGGPPAIPIVATPALPEFIDTTIPLLPGQCAYYRVFGAGCP